MISQVHFSPDKLPTLNIFDGVGGRGRIKDAANGSHRDLNVLGGQALGIRTRKPNGEPWKRQSSMERLS